MGEKLSEQPTFLIGLQCYVNRFIVTREEYKTIYQISRWENTEEDTVWSTRLMNITDVSFIWVYVTWEKSCKALINYFRSFFAIQNVEHIWGGSFIY